MSWETPGALQRLTREATSVEALAGLREAALLVAGALLLALSIELFLVPADLAPAGGGACDAFGWPEH